MKFGGLAVHAYNYQITIHKYISYTYIRMTIPYWTAKFKPANIFAHADSMQIC